MAAIKEPGISISSPTFNHHPTGLGITDSLPRLSWKISCEDDAIQSWMQVSYEVEINRDGTREYYLVDSDRSVLVPWPSAPLASRQQASVRVRSFGTAKVNGEHTLTQTDWSEWATVEAALLQRTDWQADLIAGPVPVVRAEDPIRPFRLKKIFEIQGSIRMARLYITAYGVYHAYLNSQRIGDHVMAPGFTSYQHRLNYQVFDVTELLETNKSNVLAAEVGEGWYAGRLWREGRQIYGNELGLLAQLEITLEGDEATVVVVPTDATWEWNAGPVLRSEIYDGEVYDMAQEQPDWNTSAASGHEWKNTRQMPFPAVKLLAPEGPPVRGIETISPQEIFKSPSGKILLDFGQNLVGRLVIRGLKKPAGHHVCFRHAEVLEAGELGTRPLRAAKCTDTIICSGDELTEWSPSFTFHGFRYVQVDGWSPDDETCPLQASNITALVMHSDMTRTGWFQCSHELVNRLHENAVWSMRGNFFSIPTDCPQRDERLGWTGDIQVFCASANFLYDTTGILGDWLASVAAEQADDHGVPPMIVPNVQFRKAPPRPAQAVWGDAVILVPWRLYQSFGDRALLARQYPSMTSWLEEGCVRGPDGLWAASLWQHGDWLDPSAPPEDPGNGMTDGVYVADAYLVYVTGRMGQIAEVVGRSDDAERYSKEHVRLKQVFQNKYITPAGLVASDTQTALSLGLVFSLFDNEEQIQVAGDRLARRVRFARFRVATGFAGTPVVTHALSLSGRSQLAYRMLLEDKCPSWLYPVTMGATSVWERWDSMLPDGSINSGNMTSFNHYALGSIVNWLHDWVGGLSPLEPGWKTFQVRPVPGGTITSAKTRYDSSYGRVECSWVVQDTSTFELSLTVPPNSSAWVVMPDQQDSKDKGSWLGSGTYQLSCVFHAGEWPPQPLLTLFKPPESAQ